MLDVHWTTGVKVSLALARIRKQRYTWYTGLCISEFAVATTLT